MTTDREFTAPPVKRVMGVDPIKKHTPDYVFFHPPAELPDDVPPPMPPPADFNVFDTGGKQRDIRGLPGFAQTFGQTFDASIQGLFGQGLLGGRKKIEVTGDSRAGAFAGNLAASVVTFGAAQGPERHEGTPLDLALLGLGGIGRLPTAAERAVAADIARRAARSVGELPGKVPAPVRRFAASERGAIGGEAAAQGAPGPVPPLPQGIGPNILGLRDIKPALTKRQEITNVVRRTIGKPFKAVEDNPNAQAALGERARVGPVIESQASRIAASGDEIARGAFKFDKNGGIPSLANVDLAVPGAPTIQDVAARLPRYLSQLTAEQQVALTKIKGMVEPYRDLLRKTGVEVGSRADVVDGGFYIPRSVATEVGADLPVKIGAGARTGVKKGFERPMRFLSQAEGIKAGYEYPSFRDALTSYANDAGRRATDAHITNFFKTVGEPAVPGSATPRYQSTIGLPGLAGYTFPDAIANAANKVLRDQGVPTGAGAPLLRVQAASESLYRGIRATADNSALGIHGLLGLGADPAAYYQALKVNLRAWGNEGDRILGQFINDFDRVAQAEGRLTSEGWARAALRIGGAETEFKLGQGISETVARLPLVRQANRAFGYFGDSMRLSWADDMLRDEMRGLGVFKKPRTLAEIESSGDLAKIAAAANRQTGWTNDRSLKTLGDWLLFAPRFMQSRLETVASGALGLRPGATLDQRIARTSLLKMVGWGTAITIAVNEALGHETDFRPIVDGRYNPNFMRIRALERDWSIFGTWDSLARMIVATGSGHPAEALRGTSSGLVANAWDFIGNRDFSGKPTRDNPEQVAVRLLENFVPFASGQIAADVGRAVQGDIGSAAALVPDIVGAKSSPLSATDLVNRKIAEEGFKKPDGTPAREMKDLSPSQAQKLRQDKNFQEELKRRRQASDNPRAKVAVEFERIDVERETEFAGAGGRFRAGDSTPQDFRTRVNDTLTKAAIEKRTTLRNFGVLEQERPQDVHKAALWDYYQLYEKGPVGARQVDGSMDYEEFDLRLGVLEKQWASKPGLQGYVEANTNLSTSVDSSVQGYLDTRRQLRATGYWDIYKRNPAYLRSQTVMKDYEAWREAKRNGTMEAWERSVGAHPGWIKYMQALDADEEAAREGIRWKDLALDLGVSRYYGGAPVRPENQARLIEERGLSAQFTTLGVNADARRALLRQGIDTVEKVAAMSEAQVEALPGVSPKAARDLLKQAKAAADAMEKKRRAA